MTTDHKKQGQVSTLILVGIFVMIIVASCAGCSTVVPVTAKFPDAPVSASERCSELQEVAKDAKLSELATVVSNNYRLYYECAVKVETWQEWHQKQKEIFDKVSK